MPRTLAELEKGHRFPTASFELTSDWVAAYIEATEDSATGSWESAVPPMALAALSIRALLDASPLPPGSIHVGQELAFARPAAVGEQLLAQAEVASRGERQGWVLMSVAHSVTAESGEPLLEGKATITFPADPEATG